MRTVRFRARAGHLVPLHPVTFGDGTEADVPVPVVEPVVTEPKKRLRREDFLLRDLGLRSRTITRDDAYDESCRGVHPD